MLSRALLFRGVSCALFAAVILDAGGALAQTTAAPPAVDVGSSKAVLQAAGAPTADAPVSPLTAFSVEASENDSAATLKLGFAWDAIEQKAGGWRGNFKTLSVGVSAPLDEDSGFTHLATLDGLVGSASVSLNLTQLLVPAVGPPGPDGRDDGEPCKAMWAAYPAWKAAYLRDHPNAKPEEWNITRCRSDTIQRVTDDDELAKRWEDALAAAEKARGTIWQRGLLGKVGRKSYGFYDPVTLAKGEDKHTAWQAGLFLAAIDGALNWTITGQYLHEESYEVADSKTACLAGPGPVLDCVTGPFGAPQQVTKDLLSLEVRWIPGRADGDDAKARFGVAPKLSYDAKSGDIGVGLPIYLFGAPDGLTGGVRIDWTNKDDEVVAGVFVTKAFDVANVF